MSSDIILAVKSMTFAQKAKKILARRGISISVRRLDNSQTSGGCGYGIVIPSVHHFEAIEVLKEYRIGYTVYEERKN